jgi:hypothetical protein
MIWHRTTKMYAHIIHDQIQQRQKKQKLVRPNKSAIATLD